MATIKSYTALKQSRKLAEILPLESADIWYSYYGNSKYNPTIAYKGQQWFLCQIRNSLHDDIPCWSLSALLGVLPDYTLQTNTDGTVFVVCESKKPMISDAYDNPVDACVAMIENLHELKLL